MDLIDRILDYLEGNMTLFTTFTVDVLRESHEALAIRRTPSAPSMRFLDDSRDDVIAFQILVKHKNQFKAILTINEIVKALEGLKENEIVSNENSFEFLKCELYTNPLLVEQDKRGSYVYSALFNAEVFIEN